MVPPIKNTRNSFLLAQVGAHAARRYAERLSALQLVPAHSGILRMLAIEPEISQRELASRLGMHASRLVAVIDEMETMGLLVRGSNANDRRSYSLSITPAGQQKLAEVTTVSREHDEAICEALNADERQMLASLLQRIANQQGLAPGVHPGYRNLGGRPGPPSSPSGTPARTKKPGNTS